MTYENTQQTPETRRQRLFTYAFCAIIIAIPLVVSLLKGGFATIDGYDTVSRLYYSFGEGDFFISQPNDFTFLCMAMADDGDRVLLQSAFCLAAGIALISLAKRCAKMHLLPFVTTYSLYALLIVIATLGDLLIIGGYERSYNQFMLYGRYVRALYGPLPWVIYGALVLTFLWFLIKDIQAGKAEAASGTEKRAQ